MSALHLPPSTVSAVLNDPTLIRTPAFQAQYGTGVVKKLIGSYQEGFKGVFYLTIALMGVAALSAAFLIQPHDLRKGNQPESEVGTPVPEREDEKREEEEGIELARMSSLADQA
jgi:hypothetical protein